MAKRKIKNVILVAALAAGLGLTGAAATAQAAEARETGCAHTHVSFSGIETHAVDYNEFYHIWYITKKYDCHDCNETIYKEDAEFEIHDYENVYDDYGHMVYSYCKGCGAVIR